MAEACRRYGVDSFDQVPHNRSSDSAGPVPHKRGCLIAIGTNKPVAYNPKTYRFDRVGEGVYLGAWMHARPVDFLRPASHRVSGVPIVLNDGHEWYIPQANPLVASCSLPCADALIDGDWQRVPAEAYRDLSGTALELAAAYRASIFYDKPFSMDDAELRELCGRIIAVNYDLTLQEMSALRLFAAPIWRQIIEAFIDWTGYAAILAVEVTEAGTDTTLDPPAERETPATNDTPPGAPDSSPPTTPPVQTFTS